jgi:hypothetical protein
VELKLNANIPLLIQATDRQRITDSVYVAVAKPNNTANKRWKGIKHILRRLELGLILVDAENPVNPVEIVFHPVEFQRKKIAKRKKAVIREMENRSENLNVGGSNKTKIITAYKESAIQIAVYLNLTGATSPKNLRESGCGKKTLSILSSNFYGWFIRVERGVYNITGKGKNALHQFPGLVKKYERKLRKKNVKIFE